MCDGHYQRWRNGDHSETPIGEKASPGTGGRWLDGCGYMILTLPEEGGRRISEHRYVMEQALGRRLLPIESVHHINGQKLDNRIENLELWSSTHPAGQRVADLVAWAEEITERYGTNTNTGWTAK
jgi:hypothetical protein